MSVISDTFYIILLLLQFMSGMGGSVASRILDTGAADNEESNPREECPKGAGEDCAWIHASQTMKRATPNRYEHVAHHFFFVLLSS